jgi:HSP20 family protein
MKGRKRKDEKKAKVVTGVPVRKSEFDLMAKPFSLFGDFQERMNQFFRLPFFEEARRELAGRMFSPSVDIYDEGKTLVVKAELPGVKKEEISVSVSEDFLTIKGERKRAREEKGKNFYRSESAYGNFQRSVALPHRVKPKEAKAKYEEGILRIRIPKAKGEGARSAEIKIE